MIYIIGAGYMAREYAKVLLALDKPFLVIARRESTVDEIKSELGISAYAGSIEDIIQDTQLTPDEAIVCTPVDTLASITLDLIDLGVKKILIEKPGALSAAELYKIKDASKQANADVFIGYNRRFFQSTLALEHKLKEEELTAANFEITEWAHVIADDPSSVKVKQKWVLANTSHVIDFVMHITGQFKELSSFCSGMLPWHKSAARFVGAGVSNKGILISYCGYWDGPGRWSAEFITTQNRYIFRPMEKLQVQKLGSVAVDFDETIDYELDEKFKPGIYLQTEAYLKGNYQKLCTIEEQIGAFKLYGKISNY